MAPFYLSWGYVAGLMTWLICMAIGLVVCLRLRRSRRSQQKSLTIANAGVSLWCVCALFTLAEIWCACVVDQSDAFNSTNISKRWFRRYIEAQRNSLGLRDRREMPLTLPDGQKRICFVGDSFTVGHGIRRCEDRFSDRVEALLEQQRPGKFQVANLADPGLETSQICGRVQAAELLGYQMDVVVYVFVLNDIEGYDPRTMEVITRLQKSEPRFFLFTQTYFFNWLYFRWLQATGSGGEYFSHLIDSYQEAPWGQLKAKLDELHRICREHHTDLRMAVFPFVQSLGPDYPFHAAHQKLVQYCQQSKIPVLDLEPVLTPHASEGLTVNRFDAHPNERAHELAAEAMRDQLLQDLFSGDDSRLDTK